MKIVIVESKVPRREFENKSYNPGVMYDEHAKKTETNRRDKRIFCRSDNSKVIEKKKKKQLFVLNTSVKSEQYSECLTRNIISLGFTRSVTCDIDSIL